MALDPTAQKQREAAQMSEAFDKWLNEPLVRMSISMIPASQQQDTLQMILRSSFDAGFVAGQGELAVSLMESMLQRPSDREPR